MNNKYYIYAHIRNDNNTIFYIGKGSDKRAYFKANRSKFWKRIVEKHGYTVIILHENLTEEEAYNLESKLILEQKSSGNCEANFTNGGDGVRVDKRWWNKKISDALRGKICPVGIDNKSYIDFATKEELYKLYILQSKGITEIGKLYNVSYTTVSFRLKQYNIPLRNSGRKMVKIKCLNDGLEYNSINDAAKYYNIYRENIRKVLRGIYKHTDNKIFKTI